MPLLFNMEPKKKQSNQVAISDEDYYINNEGLMVFTAKFHLKRGNCCGSGCKHCPYPKS